MTAAWPPEELERISRAEELEIATKRADDLDRVAASLAALAGSGGAW